MIQRTLISAFHILIQINILTASNQLVSQKAFKRMIFSSNSWSNLVYKAMTVDIRSNVECASHCQVFLSQAQFMWTVPKNNKILISLTVFVKLPRLMNSHLIKIGSWNCLPSLTLPTVISSSMTRRVKTVGWQLLEQI